MLFKGKEESWCGNILCKLALMLVCGSGMLGKPGFRVGWLCQVGSGPALQTQGSAIYPDPSRVENIFAHWSHNCSTFVVLCCFFWYKNTWTLNYDVISQKFEFFLVMMSLLVWISIWDSGCPGETVTRPNLEKLVPNKPGMGIASGPGWVDVLGTQPNPSHTLVINSYIKAKSRVLLCIEHCTFLIWLIHLNCFWILFMLRWEYESHNNTNFLWWQLGGLHCNSLDDIQKKRRALTIGIYYVN